MDKSAKSTVAYPLNVRMLSNARVILKRLAEKDAVAYHTLYFPKVEEHKEAAASNVDVRSPLEFTEQIVSRCNDIFTIRTTENLDKIIGDCALHHWNTQKSEIEIGGLLLPEYWGKGFMATAFSLLIPYAQREYAIDKIVANTTIGNTNALKFAEKLGFRIAGTMDNNVLLEKDL